jgi:hypothetical protein
MTAGLATFDAHIAQYISDGPGYAGPLHVRIDSERITVLAGESRYAAALPFPLPPIVAARPADDEDVEFVWSLLGEGPREYLEAPEHLDPARAVMLSFGDGRRGTLVVHGEPVLLSIGLHGPASRNQSADVEAVPMDV